MLESFSETSFTHEGITHPVLRGGSGPGVVIMHEVPGITPEVAGFAERVAAAGFSVALPDMFRVRQPLVPFSNPPFSTSSSPRPGASAPSTSSPAPIVPPRAIGAS